MSPSISSLRLLTQEGDQVIPVLPLLETTECHLGAWDVLLGILEVFELSSPLASHILFLRRTGAHRLTRVS